MRQGQVSTKVYTKKVEVDNAEYQRLKEIEKKFSYFFHFAEHAQDIKRSRSDIRKKKGIEQEKLFEQLGL